MNKIVAIALFGDNAGKYSPYLRAFIRGHLNVFPRVEGWTLRVHVDASAARSETGALIRRYADAGLCESVLMHGETVRTPPLCKAMLWRLAPVFDTEVNCVFSRDLDAAVMPRDRACCEVFLKLPSIVHTIHDNRMHAGIMGGLCAIKATEFRFATGMMRLDDLYAFGALSDEEWAQHGADQIVLNRLLARFQHLSLLEHRFNGWHAGPGTYGPRPPGEYPCTAVSTKIPNDGSSWCQLDEETTYLADRLGNHLGCAGYDHDAAVKFWDERGDKNIANDVRSCE